MFQARHVKKRLTSLKSIFISLLTLIMLFTIFTLTSCSNLRTNKDYVKPVVQVSVQIPTNVSIESNDSSSISPLNFLSKLKTITVEVYDGGQNLVASQSTQNVSDPTFSITLPSIGNYRFLVKGFNSENNVILEGNKDVNISAGLNNVTITTDFKNGMVEVNIEISSTVWNNYNINNPKIKFERVGFTNEVVEESLNINNPNITIQKHLYPSVWKVEFYSEFSEKQPGTMVPPTKTITSALYVQIYPAEKSIVRFKVDYQNDLIVNANVQTVSFPFVAPITNLSGTYNVDTNLLTLSWEYGNGTFNGIFYIYKRLKNSNSYQLIGQTNTTTFSTIISGKDFWNIESFGINVIVDGKESGITESVASNVNKEQLQVPINSSTMYKLFIRSFYDSDNDGIGDFNGVAQKVGYLTDLGIDTVWFLPFTKGKSYHCYDVEDYYDVESDYGTIDELDEMIKILNQNGIRVVMDLVVNHTSDTHPWFLDAIENTTQSPYWNYYIMSLSQPSNTNHWHWKINSRGERVWYFGLFDMSMPDLNFSNPQVVEEVKKIIDFWITIGVDGFRLDAAKHYFGWDWNDGISESANLAKQLESYIRTKLGNDCIVVSEVYDGNPSILSQFAPMPVFNFTFMYNITGNHEGRDNLLANSINWVNSIQYNLTTYHFPFIDNHDLNRFVSVLIDNKYSGNISNGTKQYLLVNALMLSLNGMPGLYYGNEIGLRGWKWSQNPWDLPVREPMQWYANQQGIGQTTWTKSIYQQNNITFGNANVDGSMYDDPNDGISVEEQQSGYTILNFFKQFIGLRKYYQALSKGSIIIERDWKNLYAIKRVYGNQEVLVLINLDPNYPNTFTVPQGFRWVWYAFFNASMFEFGPKSEQPLSQNTNWTVQPRQIYVFVREL